MPFQLSRFYLSCRERLKTLFRNYLLQILLVQGVAASVFIVFVCSGDTQSNDGKTRDLFSYGLFAVLVAVLLHHTQVALSVRGWNLLYLAIFTGSLSLTFLNFNLAESFADSQLYGGIYSVVLSSPVFWLQVGLVVGVFVLWFYLRKVWEDLVV
jgi:hypothetical protein